MIQAHQQVNVPRVPIEACRIALLLLITKEHRGDKRSMFLTEGLGEGGLSFLQGALARVGVL
jgi:hypothetical protein